MALVAVVVMSSSGAAWAMGGPSLYVSTRGSDSGDCQVRACASIGYALSRASLSAFGLRDYAEALRLGRAGYEAFSEVDHRWGLITALCRIGFAALALGDGAEARECFGEALDQAHDAQAVSLELLGLSGIGACLAEDPRSRSGPP